MSADPIADHIMEDNIMADSLAERKSRKGLARALKITGLGLLGFAVAICIIVAALFGKEIATVNSITQIDGAAYFTMEYQGDYGLAQLLEQGVASDAELVAFISGRLLKGIPLTFELPDLGCSTFAVQNAEGDTLFGRNFDNKYTPVMLVTTRPKDGYASISVVNLAFLGYGEDNYPASLMQSLPALAAPYAPMDGMNEMGLCIGVLQIDTEPTVQDTGKPAITTSSAIRMVLDQAATVDEAVNLLRQYDMHSSANACYHFQISDAGGRSVVVEYIEDEFTVVETDHATNFLLADGPWYNFGSGQDRYEILDRTLTEKSGVLTEAESMDLLQAVSQSGDFPTQWSAVYNATKKTLQLCLWSDYEQVYEYSL